jgi:mycofactocin precursor
VSSTHPRHDHTVVASGRPPTLRGARSPGTLHGMDNECDVLADAELTEHAAAAERADDLVDELLIEEISIDGMCGVY